MVDHACDAVRRVPSLTDTENLLQKRRQGGISDYARERLKNRHGKIKAAALIAPPYAWLEAEPPRRLPRGQRYGGSESAHFALSDLPRYKGIQQASSFAMDFRLEARAQIIHAGVALLALGAAACAYAPNPPVPASSAEAITGCDVALAAQVKAALRAAPAVNDIHIDVQCENDKVVLTGLVEDARALLRCDADSKKSGEGSSGR